jgi:hypothetical protein
VTELLLSEQIDLVGSPAWLHELRAPKGAPNAGEWVHTPQLGPMAQGVHRYEVPPHERLVNPKAKYPDPADDPFFKKHPVSVKNIIDAYDAVPKEMRGPGKSWYPDAHLLAKAIAGGDAEKGAILLANYSPQANWPINMFRAARAFADGKPIPAGEGYVSGDQVKKAQRALDGESIDQILISPKTRSFAKLIAQGDDSPDDPYGHVVIDAHALNVAAGGTIRGATYGHGEKKKKLPPEDDPPIGKDVRAHEYVGDQYREAAHFISVRDGELMKPYELQAITWVAQVLANQAFDRAEMEQVGHAKGRLSARAKDWERWLAWAKAHNIPLQKGVSALANTLLGQIIELVDEPLFAQIELAYNPDQARDRRGRWVHVPGSVEALDPFYNEIPETRGVSRTKGAFAAPTERELQDRAAIRAYRRQHPVAQPITAAEARGNSRPVSYDEFQELAAKGLNQLAMLNAPHPLTGLDQHWDEIKAKTYVKVQESWGGATIDAHTGQALETDVNAYALTVRPQNMTDISVPEHASEAEFNAAMDRAVATYRDELLKGHRYLGVFHDDDEHRIDIDPVLVVGTLDEVEAIGSYTHAIGGAYNFADGNGYWPPHVAEGMTMAADGAQVHFEGPGQWRTQAVRVQPGLTPEQLHEIALAAIDGLLSDQLSDDSD